MAAISVIRRARHSDARGLCDFATRQFRETYRNDTAESDLEAYISKSFSTERQETEIADPSAAVFLATADDVIIGYAHVVVGQTDMHSALLNRIYIGSESRGSGLANDLLAAVVDECDRHGIARLELTVFERNARAISFYKREGFAVTGMTTFAVGDDLQTDLVMEMDLAKRI